MPTSPLTPLAIWANRLGSAAACTLGGLDFSDLAARPTAFRDDEGTSRPVDVPLIAAALGASFHPADSAVAPEIRLWHAALDPSLTLDDESLPRGNGPLFDHPPRATIEVVTEVELCGLHALWTVARARARADLRARCLRTAAWHVHELQPDNATQMPWAIHIFVMLGVETGNAAADVDAQTRLHNALAGRGRVDRRSALILHHAARELRLAADVGP